MTSFYIFDVTANIIVKLGDVVMSIINVLKKEAEKSGGKMRVVKVPPERRPTAESLAKLEAEISAQISANEVMRQRSYINASKKW